MPILVTGAAGFIGFHTAQTLMEQGEDVVGFDNLNDYYDVSLKEARLALLQANPRFSFVRGDLQSRDAVEAVFADFKPDRVINLAAQAGVRYGMTNPHAYVDSNIMGFLNILEGCRHHGVKHLVFASSSSVYGANTKLPFSETDNVDHPVSLYAATKKSNELMAHAYAHLYGVPVTGLRFFTVYGPWGRPDMALFKFSERILAGEPIEVYNHGRHSRDFTYIDDIVAGVVGLLDQVPGAGEDASGASNSNAPYRLYNIGNNKPVELMAMIACLEKTLGRTAEKRYMDMQPGDVPETYADIDALAQAVGFSPSTSIETGIARFVEWYLDYFQKAR